MEARADGEYAKACALLTAYMRTQLGGEDCPKALRLSLEPISPKLLEQAAQIDAAAIKVEGPEAFVVYSTPGVRSQIMYVKREGGEWKVGKVNADRLL